MIIRDLTSTELEAIIANALTKEAEKSSKKKRKISCYIESVSYPETDDAILTIRIHHSPYQQLG